MTQPEVSISFERACRVLLNSRLREGDAFDLRIEDGRLNFYRAGTAPAEQAPAPSAPTPAPVEEDTTELPRPKGGRISTRAAILCAERGFQVWLMVDDKEAAAAIIRKRCGILSRAELDHNETAAAIFHDLVRDYESWLRVEV